MYKKSTIQMKTSKKFIFLLLWIFMYLPAFAQLNEVAFDPDYQIIYCSSNNGTPQPQQEIKLLIKGPEGKKWFASYSVNNSPATILNDNNGIDISNYALSLFFRNTTNLFQDFTIELKEAWLEDLTPLTISEDQGKVTIQVMPLANPEIEDYFPKAKINSINNYKAIIGKNSNYSVWIPEGAKLIKEESSIILNKKEVDLTIQWPNEIGTNYFKMIEMDAFGCNSDTIFAGIEIVSSFTADLGETKNICIGDTITLSAKTDLLSNYEYQWNTGENHQDIKVWDTGIYSVKIRDLSDNQVVNASVEVICHDLPQINIENKIVLREENHQINIYSEGCSYLWFDGSTSPDINLSKSGTYSVTKTSSFGCAATKNFMAKLEEELFKLELPSFIHMCGNEKMTLHPSLSTNQDYQFEWSNGSTESSIPIEKGGVYWIKVTDAEGFQKTAETTVVYHSNPIIDLGPDLILWDGESKVLDAGNSGANFIWNTGETTQSITVESGGIFVVAVSDQYGCSNKDTLHVDYRAGKKFSVTLGENLSICEGDSVLLTPIIEGRPVLPLKYNWINLEKSSPEIYLKDKGNYCLEVTDANGNMESDCIDVSLLNAPKINLGNDLISYPDKKIVLDAGTPNCFYNWSTGEITQKITVETEGKFWVEVTNDVNCNASDTIDIGFLEHYPFVGLPKAFSPNGDGHNDKLFIRGAEIKYATLIIYNRLGQKLFETSNINNGWDGFFNGELQNIDVYVYVLNITYLDGRHILKKGNVALLR